ncbi:MAG: hypothetical protein D6765_04590 [Bacteroidetes bacterium]|nr:MAG: hypothetical protein D6765_04590 [Bacteroidota bacterium]
MCVVSFGYAQANLNEPTECERRVEANLLSQAYAQLTTRAYGFSQAGRQSGWVLFHRDGTFQQLRPDSRGRWQVHSGSWGMAPLPNQGIQLWMNPDDEGRRAYLLWESCGGFLLTGTPSEDLKLTPLPAARARGTLERYLTGEWSAVAGSPLSKGARKGAAPEVRYRFDASGEYTKTVRENGLLQTDCGSWRLSPDGRFLLLQSQNPNLGPEVLHVKLLNEDEWVVRLPVPQPGDAASFEWLTLAFSK